MNKTVVTAFVAAVIVAVAAFAYQSYKGTEQAAPAENAQAENMNGISTSAGDASAPTSAEAAAPAEYAAPAADATAAADAPAADAAATTEAPVAADAAPAVDAASAPAAEGTTEAAPVEGDDAHATEGEKAAH